MVENNEKVVVVAGGTGDLGRHIVDGIVATKNYTVKVFTRKDSLSSSRLTDKEVHIVKVDYSDHASLVKELEGVHTVISCVRGIDNTCTQVQLSLLDACLEAKVKRFAPSQWSGKNGVNTIVQLFREIKIPVLEKVMSSGIEYTSFINGIFMDYFASPQKASPYLFPYIIGVDFNKCETNIIETGDESFCVTRAEDVGRFVAAALALNKWDERSGMVGSRTTWNQLIKLGEKVRGKKFNVKRTTIDEALSQCDPDPANRFTNFLTQSFVGMCQGDCDIEATLNQKFPEIVPTTIEEFLTEWWAGKEGQQFD